MSQSIDPRHANTGFAVQTYGGGVYTTVAWFKLETEANKEQQRILTSGCWFGMKPRVVPQ